MQAENSTNQNFGSRLKFWGKQSFNSLAKLAELLEISPQHLSAYFGGTRRPSIETLAQLHGMGADLNFLIGGSSTICATQALAAKDVPKIKAAAFGLMGRTPEDLAEDVEATPQQVAEWMAGNAQPSHRQLALFFNELTKTAATLAASRCDHKAEVSKGRYVHPAKSKEKAA